MLTSAPLRSGLIRSVASVLLGVLSVGGARAQPATDPLVLSVTPSGVEKPSNDLEALLERRMRRNDFLFRSICRGCGNSERFSGAGSFDPVGTLAKPRTAAQ